MKQKLFGTDGIRTKAGEGVLTPENLRQLGQAIATHFKKGPIILGRDSRQSGEWIQTAIVDGITSAGPTVYTLGICSTPCLAHIVKNLPAATGGIMITASHNPPSDNGIKLFNSNGDKIEGKPATTIEKIFFSKKINNTAGKKATQRQDLQEIYLTNLTKIAKGADLKPLKICIDSAAGGGWEIAQKVFTKLGAKTIEVGATPNGKNINDGCGALYPEQLAHKVKQFGADLGIALDGDADRIVLVDKTGQTWNGDRITAMLAKELKAAEKLTNNKIVLTQYANQNTINYLKKIGINAQRVINGDIAVTKRCQKIGADIGGETSGHIIYRPWLSSSDGIMIALWTASIMAKQSLELAQLWPAYQEMPQKTWNIAVKEKIPINKIAGFNNALKKIKSHLGPGSRIFVRYSGTEPKLRILVEAPDPNQMIKAGEALSNPIKQKIGA
jgi:phosphoglucosamine mutase